MKNITDKEYLLCKRIEMASRRNKMARRLFAILLLSAFVSNLTFAQAPKAFNFQGVARDATGKVFVGDINLRFTIHKNTPTGTVIYTSPEIGVSTNSSGVFTTYIGETGTPLPSIDWSNGTYFLQTEIALSPNLLDFHDMGSSKMYSVPYALYANEAAYAREASKWADFNPVVQTGAPNQGTSFPTVGNGARLVWHPKKAAFRVGSVSTGLWEDNFIGTNSFAAGNNTWAGGNTSVAIGLGVAAKADNSIALGMYNDGDNDPNRLFQIGNGTSNANRDNALTILKNGNVGIGSNSKNPLFILDIDGPMRIKHSGQASSISFNSSSNVPTASVGMMTDDQIGFTIGQATPLWVNKNGTTYMLNYQLVSDKRLKTDFKNLSGSLYKLSQLQGYNYKWLDSTRTRALQTGLVAQEVEELFPELVDTNDKGFKSVNYNGLIPHLIEAVKELKGQTAEIAELRKELNELKALTGRNADQKAIPQNIVETK